MPRRGERGALGPLLCRSVSQSRVGGDGWSFVPEAKIRKRRSIGPPDLAKRDARRGQTDGRTAADVLSLAALASVLAPKPRVVVTQSELEAAWHDYKPGAALGIGFVHGSVFSVGRFLFSIVPKTTCLLSR